MNVISLTFKACSCSQHAGLFATPSTTSALKYHIDIHAAASSSASLHRFLHRRCRGATLAGGDGKDMRVVAGYHDLVYARTHVFSPHLSTWLTRKNLQPHMLSLDLAKQCRIATSLSEMGIGTSNPRSYGCNAACDTWNSPVSSVVSSIETRVVLMSFLEILMIPFSSFHRFYV